MRWTICLCTIVLSGCQTISLLDRPTEIALIPIMPLWERYQQCLRSTNPEELISVLDQFEAATPARIDSPSWMRNFGDHVSSQPTRTAVDPQALGASCSLRVAALLVEKERIADALLLYQRILAQYSGPELVHYAHQAEEALQNLSGYVPAMLALQTYQAVSH